MTRELEAEMDAIANGRSRRARRSSRTRAQLLGEVMDELMPQGRPRSARCSRRAGDEDAKVGDVPEVRPRPAHQVLAQDRRPVRRLLGLAGVRRHLPAAAGQDRGRRRGVPRVRHAAGQGHPVPAEAARALPRPRVRDQLRAGDRRRRVPDVRASRARGRTADRRSARKNAQALRALHELRGVRARATRCRSAARSSATGETCEPCGAPEGRRADRQGAVEDLHRPRLSRARPRPAQEGRRAARGRRREAQDG